MDPVSTIPAACAAVAYVSVWLTARQVMASRYTQIAVVVLWCIYGWRRDHGVLWANLAVLPASLYGWWYWRRVRARKASGPD